MYACMAYNAMKEDIVAAVTNLSKLEDEDSMRACATIFALLSADAQGRARIVKRRSALVSLFDLLRSEDQGTQVICGKVSMPTPVILADVMAGLVSRKLLAAHRSSISCIELHVAGVVREGARGPEHP